ncbi:MAG: NPCBM/NEW2 domain-containing protein [Firmicutes bacterium]|nr:NPCBM/NEW2 domain-containing protein [Bacillota bacterium]
MRVTSLSAPWRLALAVCLLAAVAAAAAAVKEGPLPRLVVDGRPIDLNPPPLVRNGSVYVPVRALAEALGCEVRWDAANRAVIVERAAGGVDLVSALPPAEGLENALSADRPASVAGQQYARGFVINGRLTWALGGRFRTVRFLYGACDGPMTPFEREGEGRAYAEVLGDGRVLAELSAEKGRPLQEIAIPVAGVNELAIRRKWRHFHGGVLVNPAAE